MTKPDLKELKLLHRTVEIEPVPQTRVADDGEKEVFRVRFSSEEPVERWFGTEVLDHGRGAVDLSFAKKGAPVYVNHDDRDQVGVIESVELGDDRAGYAELRFGNSARAREIRQDVMDRIRRFVSVGYRIMRMRKEGDDPEKPVYRATRWRVLEVSLVGVPADETAQVQRQEGADLPVELEVDPSAPPPTRDDVPETIRAATPEEKIEMSDAPAPTPTPTPAPTPVVVDRSDEVRKDIAEVAKLAKIVGRDKQFGELVAAGLGAAEIRAKIVADQEKDLKENAATDVWDLMSPKDREAYSITRGIRCASTGDWKTGGREREVSETIAKEAQGNGYQRQADNSMSFFVPFGVQTRTLSAGTGSVGGNLVFTQPQAFIDLLRNRSVTGMAGATMLPGLTGGPIAFPRQITAGAAAWRAETPGSDDSATDSTYDQLTLSPKLIQRTTSFSKQFALQTSEEAEALTRNDLAQVLALALDASAINGGGANEPTGVLQNTNVGTVTLGANGGTITLVGLVGLEQIVADANGDVGNLAYVTNAKQRANSRQIQYFSGTNGIPLWSGGAGIDGQILAPTGNGGYNAFVSNQVPRNLTKGTATTVCSGWAFGNWSNLMVAMWGPGFELVIDPYTKKRQALIEVTAYIFGDVGIRTYGSFARIVDAL